MSEQDLQETPVETTAEQPAPATETTPEPTPAPETQEAQPEVEATPDVEAEAQPVDEPAEEEQPKKSRFQERIDKLTADKYTAEREARQLRERLEQLSQRERPQVDEDDYEAVEAERLRRVFEEERKFEAEAEISRKSGEAQQARQELFRAKLEAARDRIPDLEDSIRSFAQLPVTADSAELIADSPKAAEIAHYLGRNPDTAYELSQMSPAQQGRAIAQIESRVALPPKTVSKAPPPPATLKAQAAPQAKDPSEMTAAEYIKWRKAQWNG